METQQNKRSLFKNLKTTLQNGLKKIKSSQNNESNDMILNDFIKLHNIPECISQNTEFDLVREVFNIGESVASWKKYETQTGFDQDYMIDFGMGFLKPQVKKPLFKYNSPLCARYEYKIKSKLQLSSFNDIQTNFKNDIESVEFKFKIYDENILNKLVSYSKYINFEIISKPKDYKSENKNEFDIDKIIKVTEKTYSGNLFIMYFDKDGNRLQPLENEWWAIRLVGASKPKSVDVIENVIKNWQDFEKGIKNPTAKKQEIEFNPLN